MKITKITLDPYSTKPTHKLSTATNTSTMTTILSLKHNKTHSYSTSPKPITTLDIKHRSATIVKNIGPLLMTS